MRVIRRLTNLTLAAAAALLAAPAAAPAAVTCDYSSGGKLLTVALDAGGDHAVLNVAAGEIKVARGLTPVSCTGPGGPPSVTNTGAISVTGNGEDFQSVAISGADDFVPGPDPQDGSDDGGGTKEIEIFVNLNDGFLSTLQVGTGDDSGRIVLGANGINANAPGESVADADIFPNNVQTLAGLGGAGHDELYARGGQGTGGPVTKDIFLQGQGGSDQIDGGEGSDFISGGPGGDTLFGGGGVDLVHPGPGDDIADGGIGEDTIAITPAAGPATIDLAIASAQNTGDGADTLVGFENARSDVSAGVTLRGDDGPNVLTAGEGNDTLEGRGGVDVLNADAGADTLLVRDRAPDTADCGGDAEIDSATADPPGIDTLTGCESVIFPPPPGAGGGEAGGGESGGGGQASPAAFGARTLVTLTLAGKRIPARGPVAVRVSNANSFDVSGTLAGTRLRAKAFGVPASASRTLALRLPKALRRQLARKRRLALRLRASVRDPSGNARTIRTTVRPRLKQAAKRLGLREAHRVARIVAQRHFAQVLDARARVGRCSRVALNRASCPVVIGGPGIRCSLTLHVKETDATWRFRARHLRC